MKLLFVLVLLTAEAQRYGVLVRGSDMTGRMFTFPEETDTAYALLYVSSKTFKSYNSITVCFRSFTDLTRGHILFSWATYDHADGFHIFWDEANKELEVTVMDQKSEFQGLDYKPNMWHSICTTWVGATGLVQVWFDGKPTMKKFLSTASVLRGRSTILVGQDQDFHGGGFEIEESFVGMMTDFYIWDYVLSASEIHNYVNELNFTPGNVLSWRYIGFGITEKVLDEKKFDECH